jgi:hypothetical protein
MNEISVSKWVIATFYGWFLGIILILILSGFLDSIGIEKFQFYIGVGMGGGVGLMQWTVLRKVSPIKLQWLWASLLGLGIPFLFFDFWSKYSGFPLGDKYLPISIAAGSLLIGLLQFYVLRKHSNHVRWWLIGCILGWPLASATVLAIDYTKYISSNNWVLFAVNLILILAGGIVLGWITGKFLVKVLKT